MLNIDKYDPLVLLPDAPLNTRGIWAKTKKFFDEVSCCIDLDELSVGDCGRLTIKVHDVKFETCFISRNSDRLLVFLCGPGRRDFDKPCFWRSSYSAYFEDSCLYIDDPCNIVHKFSPTFFWGTNNLSYMDCVVEIVDRFKTVFNISNKNIIFIGNSNVGLVAMYCASKFSGCKCMALSPQVNIRIYLKDKNLYENFQNMFDHNFRDKWREEYIDVTDGILADRESQYFITSNLACSFDASQIEYLFKKLNREIKLGFSEINNITFYLSYYKVKQPHLFVPLEPFCRRIYDYFFDKNKKLNYEYDFESLTKEIFWYHKQKDKIQKLTKQDNKKTDQILEYQAIVEDKDKQIKKLKKKNKGSSARLMDKYISQLTLKYTKYGSLLMFIVAIYYIL